MARLVVGHRLDERLPTPAKTQLHRRPARSGLRESRRRNSRKRESCRFGRHADGESRTRVHWRQHIGWAAARRSDARPNGDSVSAQWDGSHTHPVSHGIVIDLPGPRPRNCARKAGERTLDDGKIRDHLCVRWRRDAQHGNSGCRQYDDSHRGLTPGMPAAILTNPSIPLSSNPNCYLSYKNPRVSVGWRASALPGTARWRA